MSRVPTAGDILTTEDLEMILEATNKRQQNFPDEAPSMSLALVMFNIGDRFTTLTCIEQEWTGNKQDIPIPPENHNPVCPNGHPITIGPRIKLGWVAVEE